MTESAPKKRPNAYAQRFLDEHGEEETKRICDAAGTYLVYFKQVCEGKRSFSRKLAEKLELASNKRMTRVGLVFGDDPPPPIVPGAPEGDRAAGA